MQKVCVMIVCRNDVIERKLEDHRIQNRQPQRKDKTIGPVTPSRLVIVKNGNGNETEQTKQCIGDQRINYRNAPIEAHPVQHTGLGKGPKHPPCKVQADDPAF